MTAHEKEDPGDHTHWGKDFKVSLSFKLPMGGDGSEDLVADWAVVHLMQPVDDPLPRVWMGIDGGQRGFALAPFEAHNLAGLLTLLANQAQRSLSPPT